MGSLGISIAGGKGSSPCKDNDEVHFITQIYLVIVRETLMNRSLKLLCFVVFFLSLSSMLHHCLSSTSNKGKHG